MSGLFQRIARRSADPPDGATTPEESDGTTQPFGAPAIAESDATATPDTTASADEAASTTQPFAPPATSGTPTPTATAPPIPSEAPTTVQPAVAVPPPPTDAPGASVPQPTAATTEAAPTRHPGFRERGRMRRRLRYLRRLRELQVRDLGGLVFDLRRFERKRDDLVAQKIDQMRACDDELQALELALDERRELRDVREPGIGGTCPRCFAIHGSTDHFCATCGAALGGAVQGPAQVAPAPPPLPTPAPVAPPMPPPASVAPPTVPASIDAPLTAPASVDAPPQ